MTEENQALDRCMRCDAYFFPTQRASDWMSPIIYTMYCRTCLDRGLVGRKEIIEAGTC